MAHANCQRADGSEECWAPLTDGFIVPVDDVRDLLPPLSATEREDDESAQSARSDLRDDRGT